MKLLHRAAAGILCCVAIASARTPEINANQPRWGGELRFCLQADPRTFHPLLVEDAPGETVAYLTRGVLLRMNRVTQAFEPELAESWRVTGGGTEIELRIRDGVRFSDGAPLTAEDVVSTLRRLTDPAFHSPAGEGFQSSSGAARVSSPDPHRVTVSFPKPVAGVERLFDQVAIVSRRSLEKPPAPVEMPVLGPWRIAEYRPGAWVLLNRNPYYWKTDRGRRLPYIDAIRLLIQQNRDLELMRFERGEIHLMNNVDPDSFERLSARSPAAARDLGPSLDAEFFWFNLAPSAAIPAHAREWLQMRDFRRAISLATHREDICRVVYRGRAAPAAGLISPANKLWFDPKLSPPEFSPGRALELLRHNGFRMDNGTLRDRSGRAVEFSMITNAGSRTRERIAAMIQQDLRQVGIRISVVTLDFPSLIERISRTFQYEACLLGLANVDIDPNGQMNVWLSSASNHPWSPRQKSPGTAWEAEIDRAMLAQAGETSRRRRKALFDRVQEIAAEQTPVIWLVHRNALTAVSPLLRNVSPAPLYPQTYWNAEHLYLAAGR